ncbi:MAG TPA: alginate lyase family protein [Terracidiphilus sp.]|nr:alginate lyase family protein [Terracidiphilus sp.]
MNRREFCFGAAAAVGAAAERVSARGIRKLSGKAPGTPLITAGEIAEIDHGWVLAAANKYLKEKPITITAYHSPRSKGGKHDYFSEGDYWWPDPKNPGGPYIRRDGYSDPANFNSDREALIRLSLQVPALMSAYLMTRDMRYARHAALHMRAWFLDPATRMNPSLTYAQAIWGVTPGRGTGVIDTLHLIEVTRAAMHLDKTGALNAQEIAGVKKWFAEYLNWMRTSKNGKDEEAAKNNHGSCWVGQAAAFAAYTGNDECLTFCRERLKSVLLPTQLAPNGSFPLELRRTKPYSYSLFDLDVLAIVCEIASRGSAADDLWQFTLPGGDRYKKAVDFMFPYIKDKSKWPYKQDVEYWDDLPNRQPSLLFAGLTYHEPKYITLWKTLPPMPKTAEIIRNFPVRQPLLWVTAV